MDSLSMRPKYQEYIPTKLLDSGDQKSLEELQEATQKGNQWLAEYLYHIK